MDKAHLKLQILRKLTMEEFVKYAEKIWDSEGIGFAETNPASKLFKVR